MRVWEMTKEEVRRVRRTDEVRPRIASKVAGNVLQLPKKGTLFSPAQLNQLRASFSAIERVNPDDPKFLRVRAMMYSLAKKNPEAAKQIEDAGIKWLSYLVKMGKKQ